MKKYLLVAGLLLILFFILILKVLGPRQNGTLPETITPTQITPTTTSPNTPSPSIIPVFNGEISTISEEQKNLMLSSGSWRQGCPVPISDLRVLSLTYWDFDNKIQQGELMVHNDVAESVLQVFKMLFDSHYRIHRIELVEKFDADDEKSMLSDNTSGFNCRGIPGSTAWSEHAYGRAIDLNPFENPEIRNGKVDPQQAFKYVDRSLSDIGVIHPNDPAIKAFSTISWKWGGDWASLKDYQHFSLSGN